MSKNISGVITFFLCLFSGLLNAQSGGVTFSSQLVSCDTYMDAGPLTRATSFGEEQVVNGVYQGLAQQYNNISGMLKSVVFWARVNPAASSSSNTVKVVVYSANQGLPGPILGSQNVVLNVAGAPYQVIATFSTPINVNGSIILSIEPFSPTTDNFFVQRNTPPDGQFLNLTKIKQASQWFKNLAAGDPTFDYDFIILPVKAVNVTANFTGNTLANTTTFTNTSVNATTYEWDFGDGGTSIVASPTHNYAASGTYNVKLKAFASGVSVCIDSVTIPVSVVITGLNELSSNNSTLVLEGNIVRNSLTITASTNTVFSICDALGARMGNYTIRKNETLQIDITNLVSGVYYITSVNNEAIRFLKNNN